MKTTHLFILFALFLFSCSKQVAKTSYSINNTIETAQQIGDAMAAIDEFGGTVSGDISQNRINSYEKSYARLSGEEANANSALFKLMVPTLQADNCNNVDFGTCSAAFQKLKNLTGCTTAAGGTISGVVTLTYTGTGNATCTIPGIGDSVNRIPNIGINGLRGAVFGLNSPSGGQNLVRTSANTFTFSDSGSRRRFTGPDAVALLDMTATTSGTMTISGTTTVSTVSRNARTVSGGAITIVNNINSVSCEFVPSSVTWDSTCNCPTSGTWTAACSDASNFSLAFGSTCGQATVTKDSTVSTVVMDRCE